MDMPVSNTVKMGQGDRVYSRNVYADGRVEYVWFDINDPGQNEYPSSQRAYTQCQGEEIQRY
jgi:hypothetical protein